MSSFKWLKAIYTCYSINILFYCNQNDLSGIFRLTNEPRREKTSLWVSNTNRAVQLQKMARNLKFRIYTEEGSYYPWSENKGADQLRSYCAADLPLCYHIYKKPVFS